ncbi:MAG: UpxY family transcription antiterminator [Chitinophagaceae bacterium]|nr:UpxY family transcription antiterminator [Chitinophagaceae bacterium]
MQLICMASCLSIPITHPLKAALCYQIIFIMTSNWYAVYTKPQQEQKVTAALTKKGIDAYCPLTRIGVYTGFGKKTNWRPLFPSFVFVYITEAQFTTVRQASDIINFMYWLGRPGLIPEAEIKSIQQFTSTHPKLAIEKTVISKNAATSTTYEPVDSSFNGIASKQKIKIKLLLPSLGYILVAETERPAGIFDYSFDNVILS